MFLLKKIFQLREHANADAEKPFLDHLEDLRIMITKVTVTLVLAMLGCFTFQNKIMQVLRHPVERVWYLHQQTLLPEKDKVSHPLTVEIWERAKKVEQAAAPLNEVQRKVFYQQVNDEAVVYYSQIASYLRAALLIEEEHRAEFLSQLPIPDVGRAEIRAMLQSKANPEISAMTDSQKMSALKPTETFMLSMKLSFFAGIIVAFPLLMYFVLQFILPGLHEHEKRILWPSLAIGFGLFLSGVLFAYFLVLPKALVFFFEWGNEMGISNDWRIGEYISFATQFTLLFGASFELPVVVMVLVKLGLLSYQTMRRTRNYAIVAIFIIAAVLTPTPDIPTQCLMACPMIFLYEACIWLAWWDEKKRAKAEAAESHERVTRLLEEHGDLDPYAPETEEHPQSPSHSEPEHPEPHPDETPESHADPDHSIDPDAWRNREEPRD